MLRRLATAPGACCLAVVAGIAGSAVASAHVVQTFGKYTIAIGWQHEPTYAGQLNAVQLLVKDAAGNPVTDLGGNELHVQISAGGVTSSKLDFQPSFDPDTGIGSPGEYDAAVIPTLVGTYTFALTADLHGTAVQQSFTSGATTFDSVSDATPVEFPASAPSNSELASRITRDAQRLETALASARQASDTAGHATVLASVAAALALLLAAVVGVTAVVRLRRRSSRA